jgi:hypothetical protein
MSEDGFVVSDESDSFISSSGDENEAFILPESEEEVYSARKRVRLGKYQGDLEEKFLEDSEDGVLLSSGVSSDEEEEIVKEKKPSLSKQFQEMIRGSGKKKKEQRLKRRGADSEIELEIFDDEDDPSLHSEASSPVQEPVKAPSLYKQFREIAGGELSFEEEEMEIEDEEEEEDEEEDEEENEDEEDEDEERPAKSKKPKRRRKRRKKKKTKKRRKPDTRNCDEYEMEDEDDIDEEKGPSLYKQFQNIRDREKEKNQKRKMEPEPDVELFDDDEE